MKRFEIMNAVTLFLPVAKARPAAFWLLIAWMYGLLLVAGLVTASLGAEPLDPENVDLAANLMPALFGILVQAVIGFALVTVWVRLLGTGTVAGVMPFNFGPNEKAGLIAMVMVIALTFAVTLIAFMMASVLQLLTSPVMMGMLFVPLVILAIVYVTIRTVPAVALSLLTAQPAFKLAWRETSKIFGGLLGGFITVVIAAMILAGLNLVLTVTLISAMGIELEAFEAAMNTPGLSAVELVFQLLQTAFLIPIQLMSISLATSAALHILGWDNEWTREIGAAREA